MSNAGCAPVSCEWVEKIVRCVQARRQAVRDRGQAWASGRARQARRVKVQELGTPVPSPSAPGGIGHRIGSAGLPRLASCKYLLSPSASYQVCQAASRSRHVQHSAAQCGAVQCGTAAPVRKHRTMPVTCPCAVVYFEVSRSRLGVSSRGTRDVPAIELFTASTFHPQVLDLGDYKGVVPTYCFRPWKAPRRVDRQLVCNYIGFHPAVIIG